MATFRPGDAVEYVDKDLAFRPLVGAIGYVERVTDKFLYVTWVSVPFDARHWDFVKIGAKERWLIENFRKVAGNADVREG